MKNERGNRLRLLLERMKLSQTRFATAIPVHRVQVARWVTGRGDFGFAEGEALLRLLVDPSPWVSENRADLGLKSDDKVANVAMVRFPPFDRAHPAVTAGEACLFGSDIPPKQRETSLRPLVNEIVWPTIPLEEWKTILERCFLFCSPKPFKQIESASVLRDTYTMGTQDFLKRQADFLKKVEEDRKTHGYRVAGVLASSFPMSEDDIMEIARAFEEAGCDRPWPGTDDHENDFEFLKSQLVKRDPIWLHQPAASLLPAALAFIQCGDPIATERFKEAFERLDFRRVTEGHGPFLDFKPSFWGLTG